MASAIDVDRARWLGYRWEQHGLAGGGHGRLDDLLLLGIQGTRQAGADQSLIQRTSRIGRVAVAAAISLQGPLVSVWSVRGAPHAHRLTQLDAVRAAVAPQQQDDGGAAHVEAVAEVAAALARVVTAPMTKGEASAGVTPLVDPSLVTWCGRCEADHVPEGMFRAAGCQARLILDPSERATVLLPAPSSPSTGPADHPRLELLRAFFRVNGPISLALVRDWFGGDRKAAANLWKDGGATDASATDDARDTGALVTVRVDGARCAVPEAVLEKVEQAPRPRGVVLVPPGDPYLRQVDHHLLVPDARRRQQVWRALSGPGAVLADGEVAGIWRYRQTGNALTITPFETLTAAARTQAEKSAQSLGAVLGDVPRVSWD